MSFTAPSLDHLSFDITEESHVRASLTATFAALLEEIGPSNKGINETPWPMVLEAWPGGRWFRDLGEGNGHLWGHVQAIKRPTLLEISGPLMMSFAAVSNLQFRLTESGGGTLITLRHSALGLFPDGYREDLTDGLPQFFDRIRRRAEHA